MGARSFGRLTTRKKVAVFNQSCGQERGRGVVTTMSTFRTASLALTVTLVVTPGWAFGQSVPADAGAAPNVTGQTLAADDAPGASTSASVGSAPSPVNPTLANTFTSVGGDLKRMFSKGSLSMGLAFAGTALVSTQWDRAAVGEFRELPASNYKLGNTYGALMTQVALGFGTFAVGKATGNNRIATTGSHLIRAQIASQVVVQGLKYTAGRSRPDASNQRSFPSGHTASAFATATVLQRDFGWKVGIPAYAVGAYVAASRMGSNKHYLSDVLIGAAIGITAGRSVTVGSGRAKFDVGFAPAGGGAAVTFTKK
jgi:membrane-associated phospholipid phosphatase